MKKYSVVCCLTAILATLALTGCTTKNVTFAGANTPVTGQADAPFTFVGSASLPVPPGTTNPLPLIGFDISWVDATTHMYYLGAAQYAGIVTLDLNSLTSPSGLSTASFFGQQAGFGGSISDATSAQGPDSNHPYEGGPNGVIVVGGTEVWAADGSPYTYTNAYPYGPTIAYSNDACNSSVKVINLSSNAVTPIYTNGCFEADELSYDSDHNLVLVTNPEEDPSLVTNPNAGTPTSPFISLLSTTSKTLVAQIPFDGTNGSPNAVGGIEQSVYSSKMGYFYVAVPADGPADVDPYGNPVNGAIAVIDPVAKAVVGKIALTTCAPSGMALGPDGQEVFLGCSSGTGPQVVSLVDGTMLASFPQIVPVPANESYFGPMCDEVWFNPTLNEYLAACQFAYGNSGFGVVDAGTGLDASSIKFVQYVVDNTNGPTSLGAAHSIASDPTTGAVIVPLPFGLPGTPECQSPGCLGVWAPEGSKIAKPY